MFIEIEQVAQSSRRCCSAESGSGCWSASARVREHGLKRLYPTSNPKLWGLPHPAWAGVFAAEQSALRTAELWWVRPVGGYFRLWPEQLWFFLWADPEHRLWHSVCTPGIWLHWWLWQQSEFSVLLWTTVLLPWIWPAASSKQYLGKLW